MAPRPKLFIFDLDGVILQSPGSRFHPPVDWPKYWADIDAQRPNQDVVDLIQILKRAHPVLILTARPVEVVSQTVMVLKRIGLPATPIDAVPLLWPRLKIIKSLVYLKMMKSEVEEDGETPAIWKRLRIEELVDVGWNVQFMVEDYKTNADEIRKVVPVLLYENKR